ncbi:MAG: hypothetical protein KIS81_06195 [Maricaulaceae bacterium]|nr:hypothetical protein [Maricaulaceae bacterium]
MAHAAKNSALAAILAVSAFVAAPVAYADPPVSSSAAGEGEVQPWYESFTFSPRNSAPGQAWDDNVAQFEWTPTSRWGFTLGIERDPESQYEVDGVSAGAYFNISPRLRFGGAVRFSAPEERFSILRRERGEREPEVKFESALRF